MSAPEPVTAPTEYEITIEPDDGARYDHEAGAWKEWRGYRIRYRARGKRVWRTFLLEPDDGRRPPWHVVELAVRYHAAAS